jgi:hypothetical protein
MKECVWIFLFDDLRNLFDWLYCSNFIICLKKKEQERKRILVKHERERGRERK